MHCNDPACHASEEKKNIFLQRDARVRAIRDSGHPLLRGRVKLSALNQFFISIFDARQGCGYVGKSIYPKSRATG